MSVKWSRSNSCLKVRRTPGSGPAWVQPKSPVEARVKRYEAWSKSREPMGCFSTDTAAPWMKHLRLWKWTVEQVVHFENEMPWYPRSQDKGMWCFNRGSGAALKNQQLLFVGAASKENQYINTAIWSLHCSDILGAYHFDSDVYVVLAPEASSPTTSTGPSLLYPGR